MKERGESRVRSGRPTVIGPICGVLEGTLAGVPKREAAQRFAQAGVGVEAQHEVALAPAALGADHAGQGAPLVLLLPGLGRWSAAERRALAAVIRAKGGRRESEFVRRFDAHSKLRYALAEVAGTTRA